MRTTTRHTSGGCTVADTGGSRRHHRKNSGDIERPKKIGHLVGKSAEKKGEPLNLPEPSEEMGVGDILKGLMEDPSADPVAEVRELRRSR
jgi:hypothetical protein